MFISSNGHFIKWQFSCWPFLQLAISKRSHIKAGYFHQLAASPIVFHKLVLSIIGHFINLLFHQKGQQR
jgi:hypothetical protein